MVSLGELEVNLPFQTLDFGGNATSDVHSYLGSDSQGEFKYNLQIEIQAGYRISIKILPLRGRNTDGLIRTFVKEAIKVSSSANVDTTVSSTNQPGSGQFPAQPGYQRPNPAIFPGIGNPQGDYSSPIAIPPKKKKKLRRPSETVTSGAVARSSTDSWHDDPEIQHSDHREPKDPTNTDVDAIVKEENTAMFSEDTATDTKDGDSMDGDDCILEDMYNAPVPAYTEFGGSNNPAGMEGRVHPPGGSSVSGSMFPLLLSQMPSMGSPKKPKPHSVSMPFKVEDASGLSDNSGTDIGDALTIFQCKACKKQFTQKRYLTEHWKRQHSHRDVHFCSHCGKTYPYMSGLKKHIETKHGGIGN